MKKAFTFLPGLRPDTQDSQSGEQAIHFFLDDSRLTHAYTSSALRRRKEQLRKAQRTHRQRKNQYFKTLESEVLRLRASEASLTLQIQDLRNQLEALQAPPDIQELSPFDIPNARFRISENDGHATCLNLHHGESPTHQSSWNTNIDILSIRSSKRHNDESGFMNTHHPAPFSYTTTILNPSNVTYDKSKGLDMIGAGMEFVLALESPCLPHLNPLTDKPNGHSLLASSALVSPHHHHHQCIPPILENNASLSENSALIFSRLLALSEQLICADEISPTQAWCYILQQPWAHRLEQGKLGEVKASLLKIIKCYGFGAVMRRDSFDAILFQFASGLN